MAAKKYIIQHRRGTLTQWDGIIPREGELVIELDEVNKQHKLKIGDGIHTFEELEYLTAGEDIVIQKLSEIKPRVVEITLNVDSWVENGSGSGDYYQIITLDDITEYSKLDLQPSAEMLAEFKLLNLVFVTENHNKTIYVHSIGDRPIKSYTMQATIIETTPISSCDKIVGIPVGTPTSKSDWNATDATKANYIDNKPTAEGSGTVFSTRVENGQFIIEQNKNIYVE